MEQQSLIYSFVARGTVILSEYTEFTGDFASIASQYLQKIPASNNEVTYNFDGRTFNYLVDDGYTYCVVAVESAGRQIPIAFLERIKEEFTKKYGGGKAATAVANCLNREFGPKLKEQMHYCLDHPDEISNLSKVKAHVSEVEGVMMENIEKVLDRGEKIELLVDKTENLCSQDFENEYHTSVDLQEFSRKWKKIVWVIKIITSKEGIAVENIGTAFSVDNDGCLILTSAHLLGDDPVGVMVRRLHDEGFQLVADLVYQKPEWDIAILKLIDVTGYQCGYLAEDGALSEGQTLLHLGNASEFIGSFLVGKVAFQCTNDMELPEGNQRCIYYTSNASEVTPRYRVMGHVWHKIMFGKLKLVEASFESNVHPLVPIIQMNGFGAGPGCSGGPVFNLKGHIVGMTAMGSGGFVIAIHVALLRECLRLYKEEVKLNQQ